MLFYSPLSSPLNLKLLRIAAISRWKSAEGGRASLSVSHIVTNMFQKCDTRFFSRFSRAVAPGALSSRSSARRSADVIGAIVRSVGGDERSKHIIVSAGAPLIMLSPSHASHNSFRFSGTSTLTPVGEARESSFANFSKNRREGARLACAMTPLLSIEEGSTCD